MPRQDMPPLTEWDFDISKPFHWKPDNGKQATPAERNVAVTHVCKLLERGDLTVRQIVSRMEPRLPYDTFKDWQKRIEDVEARVQEAFELGMDNLDRERQMIADGNHKLKRSVDRDKLRCDVRAKRLLLLSTRHRPKTILSNDPENPLPSQYIVGGVAPKQRDDDDAEA
jgi:hypothetical protein